MTARTDVLNVEEPLLCSACGLPFVKLSGGAWGCNVHGIRRGIPARCVPDLLAALQDIAHGTAVTNSIGETLTRGNSSYRTRAQIHETVRAAIRRAGGGR